MYSPGSQGRRVSGAAGRRFSLPILIVLVAAAFAGGYGLATTLANRGGGLVDTPRGGRRIRPGAQRPAAALLQTGQRRAAWRKRASTVCSKTLNDPYTEYFTPAEAHAFAQMLAGTYSGVGIVLQQKGSRLQVTRVLPGSPAGQANVRPGDVIVKVDGVATAGRSLDVNIAHLQGQAGTTVRLELRRTGTPKPITLTSATRRELSFPLTSSRLIADHGVKVGYVSLSEFASGAGAAVRQDVTGLQKRGARWIILDLRDNGGGLVDEAIKVASEFLSKDSVIVLLKAFIPPRTCRTPVAPARPGCRWWCWSTAIRPARRRSSPAP